MEISELVLKNEKLSGPMKDLKVRIEGLKCFYLALQLCQGDNRVMKGVAKRLIDRSGSYFKDLNAEYTDEKYTRAFLNEIAETSDSIDKFFSKIEYRY